MKNLIYPQLSYQITGLCFSAQKDLGRFCKERQYADKLEQLFKNSKIEYQREFEIKNIQPKFPIGNRVDFLVSNKIIIDLKTKNFITKDDYFQIQRYLKAANLELGMIINFRDSHLNKAKTCAK